MNRRSHNPCSHMKLVRPTTAAFILASFGSCCSTSLGATQLEARRVRKQGCCRVAISIGSSKREPPNAAIVSRQVFSAKERQDKKTRCSPRTQMQSHRTLSRNIFLNSLVHVSPATVPVRCRHCGMWKRAECKVWSVKCRVWSVECGVSSVECVV